MGAIAAIAKGVPKLLLKLVSGLTATLVSTLTNTLILALVMVRFIIMTTLKSMSTVVEFAGETTLNIIAFTRDTVFSILTFIVQTVTSVVLFLLNQFVSIWRLIVSIISITLGETCFLAKNLFSRSKDLIKDVSLTLKAFSTGVKGISPVVKAQVTDLKSGVGLMAVVKQSLKEFKEIVKYIFMGDEGKITDGIIPSFLTELFKVLPLSFDLAKIILQGTIEVSKETVSTSFSILKELVTLKGISLGCKG